MSDTETSKKQNTNIVLQWVEACNEHDVKKIGETLHSGYEYDFSDTSIKGKEKAISAWGDFLKGLPDMKYEVQQIIAEGEYVVARLRMTGTHFGPLVFEGFNNNHKPLPATNKKIDLQTCGVYHIKDGKILKLIRYWDSETMFREIES